MDVNEGRLRILGETAKSHQVAGLITAIYSDLRVFAETKEVKYDKLLLDAPCSGIGVLSKLNMPGGFLIYSTCSIDPEENQGRVEAFLLRHPEFSVDPVDRLVPSSFVTSQGVFLSNPVKHSLDGAFAARLVRAL
ncbi:BnaA02g25120D [Brassica napus]|uniref:BnaA02g25120D protein n=1 Tax=Brassica napus TaxID=3708 RepID=A0A078GUZ9_BRANA|nr:BnaA02g25120D [Brassica napus]